MKGDNTYFGLDSTADILKLQGLEADLDQRHANDIENRLDLGRIYREVKTLLPKDGTWGNWLKARHYSERECYRLMSISEFVETIGDSCPIGQKFRSWATFRHLDEAWGHLQTWADDSPTLMSDDDDYPVFMKVLEKISAADDGSVSVPVLEQFEVESWADHRRDGVDEHDVHDDEAPEIGGTAVPPKTPDVCLDDLNRQIGDAERIEDANVPAPASPTSKPLPKTLEDLNKQRKRPLPVATAAAPAPADESPLALVQRDPQAFGRLHPELAKQVVMQVYESLTANQKKNFEAKFEVAVVLNSHVYIDERVKEAMAHKEQWITEERKRLEEWAEQLRLREADVTEYMTEAEFKLVRGALHPDRAGTDNDLRRRLEKAFRIFERLEPWVKRLPISVLRARGWVQR
jgi:hypothetical protein